MASRSTWGKNATSRIDRSQFANDELLQSLGTQFNVDFADYDQWTRKSQTKKPTFQRPGGLDGDRSRVSILAGRRTGSADSCHHGTSHLTYREKKQAAKQQVEDKERGERMKITDLRLQTRRKTLDEYEKRYAQLIEQNIILRADIEDKEKGTLDHVKGLLRKYEKYRGGIAILNKNFGTDFQVSEYELEDTKQKLDQKLQALEQEVEELDDQLKVRQDELHVLMSYKDKEYPVKAMRISNLQKEIQSLKISNEEDLEELEHITRTELSKYDKEKTSTQNMITKSVTENAITMMHPSLKDMALQNMVMKKEIEFHTKEQEELEKSISVSEHEVKTLLHDPKTNTRLQMFPEFFPTRQKCTPDMDVILDIPTQEWLPI